MTDPIAPSKKRKREEGDELVPEGTSDRVQLIIAQQALRLARQVKRQRQDGPEGDQIAAVYSRVVTEVNATPGGVHFVDDPRALSIAGTQRAIAHGVQPQDMHYAGGVLQKGRWEATGTASGPRYKAADRALQLLNQLSQVLLRAAAGSQEVEAMLVNGRILVSANETSSVEALVAQNLGDLLDAERAHTEEYVQANWAARKGRKLADLGAALTDEDDGGPLGPSGARGAERLGRLEVDLAVFPGQREAVAAILDVLREVLVDQVAIVAGGPAEVVAGMIDDDANRNRIIAVDAREKAAGPCTHAEQNLLHALVLSGYTGPAYVAGGKRPCTVCWLSHTLARMNGYDVTFNTRRGGFWDGRTTEGVMHIGLALGYNENTLAAEIEGIRAVAGDQHVTNLAEDAPLRLHVPNLPNAVHTELFATDTASQSDSDYSDHDVSDSDTSDSDEDDEDPGDGGDEDMGQDEGDEDVDIEEDVDEDDIDEDEGDEDEGDEGDIDEDEEDGTRERPITVD
ncbi:hypothetical protein [Actinokineospora bangkokensis]|uniref:Uncharacterized protein n=1 Tax=Actinokineospora bangkokensis TaxID=1193682 RepID=A0A1Q9LJN9_9PSEU|nr:hypothetical protein [Actinokineospora bangkokensis]OLR92215.1 hypothetical protein BJP25_23100 [Actinokineospora bangkokensis]